MAPLGRDLELLLPKWSAPLVDLPSEIKFIALSGGRASGKTETVGRFIILSMMADPELVVLCGREHEKDLWQSSYAVFKTIILDFKLEYHFEVLAKEIRNTQGGGKILFKGVSEITVDNIKSIKNIRIFWMEEAHTLTEKGIRIAFPSFRTVQTQDDVKAGVEPEPVRIFLTYNPEFESTPIEKFIFPRGRYAEDGAKNAPRKDVFYIHTTYLMNEFLSAADRRTAEYLKEENPDAYRHDYLGEYDTRAGTNVFKNVLLGTESNWPFPNMEKNPEPWDCYYGLDYGYNDPTAAVRCFIRKRGERVYLYIDAEMFKTELPVEGYDRFLEGLPGVTNPQVTIVADTSNPVLTTYIQNLKKNGMPKYRVRKADKGAGSIENGITRMQSMIIVVHPDCPNVYRELVNFKYRIDAKTKEFPIDRASGKPKILYAERDNHAIDAVRYALEDASVDIIAGASQLESGYAFPRQGLTHGHMPPPKSWLSNRDWSTSRR